MEILSYIEEFLFANKDEVYRDFTAKLIPNIDSSTIVGVRTPVLRKFAQELYKRDDIELFLNSLPHKYHEENLLHSFLISKNKNFDDVVVALDLFLPYVTNWAVCDVISPKVFAKNADRIKPIADKWILNEHTYVIRYGISVYMSYRLKDYFDADDLQIIGAIDSDEYYVNMMRAWYFATALAFQYDETIKIIEAKSLDKFTHNKSIQKAIESFRVTEDHKAYLKTLKV